MKKSCITSGPDLFLFVGFQQLPLLPSKKRKEREKKYIFCLIFCSLLSMVRQTGLFIIFELFRAMMLLCILK